MRISFYIFTIFLLIGCSTPDKEIKYFPKEFRGEWIDKFGEFKMVITESKIFLIDPNHIDKIQKKIKAIYKTSRRDCDDCTQYGIKIKYYNTLEGEDYFYLNVYHPELKKYIILEQVESLINPNTDTRVYYEPKEWKRSDL
jgi:hypothetical protein